MIPPKFEGRSCYTGDYVEHPIESPEKTKRPAKAAAWEPNNVPMTARSTYTENYPWHDAQPKQKNTRPAAATHTTDSPPFQGTSSYKIDYIKHEAQRPKSAMGQRRKERSMPSENVPFNGTTTYVSDYKKHL